MKGKSPYLSHVWPMDLGMTDIFLKTPYLLTASLPVHRCFQYF